MMIFPLFNLRHLQDFRSTTSRRETLYFILCRRREWPIVGCTHMHALLHAETPRWSIPTAAVRDTYSLQQYSMQIDEQWEC